ncbi:MAG: CBS domain-containing protein [Phycisphaera sp. TMED9]|nr:MAG: CBS domain-containing protein [Phycisphaera sp. TMED9]
MATRLWNLVLGTATRLGFSREWWMLVVAAGVGLFMGVAGYLFIKPIQMLEHQAEVFGMESPSLLLWLLPVIPVIGAILTGVLAWLLPSEFNGHGVSNVIFGVTRRQSRLRLRLLARQWIGSTLTIGSGGSAGPEGPIVTIGAVVGSNLARLLRLDAKSGTTLLGCGAAAGLASVFNAPIAGIFFVLEVLLRDFSLRTFTPIVVASVLAAATTQTIIGSNEPLFGVGPSFFADNPIPFTIGMTPAFVVFGVVCGLVAVSFIRTMQWSERCFSKIPVPGIIRPGIGALLLGLLGVGYMLMVAPWAMSGDADPVPPFLGNGYMVIFRLLETESYSDVAGSMLANGPWILIGVLLLWAVLKIVSTSLTLGSGGAGGLFAPALVVGAIVGSLFGVLVVQTGWFPNVNPAHFALVGMAAMVAATTHAPMTGVMLVYEITQTYSLIVPLMLCAVLSVIVGRLLYRESVYTAELAAAGIRVGSTSDLTLLRQLTVRDVPLMPPVTVRPNDSGQRLLELSERFAVSDFVVVDEKDNYLGMVTGTDLQAALVFREAIPLLQVNEIERTDLPSVVLDDTLDVALDRFSEHDAASLAVLSNTGDGRVIGVLTRTRLMREYQHALAES